jgi:hypothetical protein
MENITFLSSFNFFYLVVSIAAFIATAMIILPMIYFYLQKQAAEFINLSREIRPLLSIKM